MMNRKIVVDPQVQTDFVTSAQETSPTNAHVEIREDASGSFVLNVI